MTFRPYLLAIPLVSLLTAGCYETRPPFRAAGPEETSVSVPVVPSPAATVNDFYVQLKPVPGTAMLLHPEGDWTKECVIKAGQTEQDLSCVLEAAEMDLHELGLTLAYNVPTGMCDYLTFMPYYFYQYETGSPPASVTVNVDTEGKMTIASQSSATAPAIVRNNDLTCTADYSSQHDAEGGGPNCCEGTYTLTTFTTTNAGTTASTSTKSWGGKVSNCLAGPAMDSQPKSKSGWPKRLDTFLEAKGLAKEYSIASPLEKEYRSNAFLANWFAAEPDYAAAKRPIPVIQPWYEFRCTDNADEAIHRIRVLIRSWSSRSGFNSRTAGNPTAFGPHGLAFTSDEIWDYPAWPANAAALQDAPNGFGDAYPGSAL